ELDALPACGIEQKQKCALVLGKVRKRKVLPVASEIRKANRSVINHFDKAFWAAPVLNIRSAVCRGGGQKGGILFSNKCRQIRGYAIRKTFRHAPLEGLCGAAFSLCMPCCRRKDSAGIVHGVIARVAEPKIAARCC